MNLLFISLGCDKNLVDSEVMLGILDEKGWSIVDDEAQADVIVITPAVSSTTPRKKVSRPSWRWRNIRKKEG